MNQETCAAWTQADEACMREALVLASRGAGKTHPNPAVGAVVVREGQVLGRGCHKGPGTNHAEVEALLEAGQRSRGADLYVTLEPCCTWGRTPPCTGAILEAGIRRVVAACADPNPSVCGKGAQELVRAGVRVSVGLLRDEGRAADEAYHHFWERGRPFVHLKWAQSLDGRAERPGGGYLTGREARALMHRDRSLADAILVSAGTVLRDAPRLTVREGFGPKRLLRVILDRRGRIRGTEDIFGTSPEGEIWVVRPRRSAGEPFAKGSPAALKTVPDREDGSWDLDAVLGLLREGRTMYLYAEAVGRLSRQFLAEGLVDRLSIHVAPLLAGGDAVPALGGECFPPDRVPDLRGGRWERAGEDWIVTKDFARPSPAGRENACSRG